MHKEHFGQFPISISTFIIDVVANNQYLLILNVLYTTLRPNYWHCFSTSVKRFQVLHCITVTWPNEKTQKPRTCVFQARWTLKISWQRLSSWKDSGTPSWSSSMLCVPWRNPSTSSLSWWSMAACWITFEVCQPHFPLQIQWPKSFKKHSGYIEQTERIEKYNQN